MKVKKTSEEKTKDLTEEIAKDKEKIEQLIKYKKRFEPRWYLSSAFWEGIHFTYGAKDKNGNWIRVPMPKGKILREIPKAKKQLRSIRNMILKIKQKPVVYPDKNVILQVADSAEKVEAEIDKSIKTSMTVEYYWNEVLKLQRHLKKLVRYGGMYGVAYIQLLNEDGNLSLEVHDPFEVSIYPTISSINEFPYFVKHVSKRISDIKESDMYDQAVISEIEKDMSEGRYSESQYKDSLMKERYGNPADGTVLIDELYELVKVSLDKDGEIVYDDELAKEEVERVRIRSYIGTKRVREEMTNLTKLPISMFVWEDEAYAQSFLEELMPLNKAYDVFVSKLEQKVKKIDTGRFSIQKSEDAKVITTNDGEFIRWKRNKPEVMREGSVDRAFFEMIGLLERDIIQQGVSVATGIGLPSGVEAWRAIETLKESDYASIGTQVDNLRDCLVDLTEKLIEMLASDLTTAEQIQIPQGKGKSEVVSVIGKSGLDIREKKETKENEVVLDPNQMVKVEEESGLSWTEQGKKELVLKMVAEGLLPPETAIEMLKVGNTQEIIKKLKLAETEGRSIVDMAEFKMLPDDLQDAIAKYLSEGGRISRGQ